MHQPNTIHRVLHLRKASSRTQGKRGHLRLAAIAKKKMEEHSRLRKPHLTERQGSMLPSGKEFTCQCRRHRRRRCVFNPWVGKIWRRKWQPTSIFLPGKSHGQRSLVGYSPRDRKESDTAEHAHMCTHTQEKLSVPAHLGNYR